MNDQKDDIQGHFDGPSEHRPNGWIKSCSILFMRNRS